MTSRSYPYPTPAPSGQRRSLSSISPSSPVTHVTSPLSAQGFDRRNAGAHDMSSPTTSPPRKDFVPTSLSQARSFEVEPGRRPSIPPNQLPTSAHLSCARPGTGNTDDLLTEVLGASRNQVHGSGVASSSNGCLSSDSKQATYPSTPKSPLTYPSADDITASDVHAFDDMIKIVAAAVVAQLHETGTSLADHPDKTSPNPSATLPATENSTSIKQEAIATGDLPGSVQSRSPSGASLFGIPSSFVVNMGGTLRLSPESGDLGMSSPVIKRAAVNTEPMTDTARPVKHASGKEIVTALNLTPPRTTLAQAARTKQSELPQTNTCTKPKPKNLESPSTTPSLTQGKSLIPPASMVPVVQASKTRIQSPTTSSTIDKTCSQKVVTFASDKHKTYGDNAATGVNNNYASSRTRSLSRDLGSSPAMTRVAQQVSHSGNSRAERRRLLSSHQIVDPRSAQPPSSKKREDRSQWSGHGITSPPSSYFDLHEVTPGRRQRRPHSADTAWRGPPASMRPSNVPPKNLSDSEIALTDRALFAQQSPSSLQVSEPRVVEHSTQIPVRQDRIGVEFAVASSSRPVKDHPSQAITKVTVELSQLEKTSGPSLLQRVVKSMKQSSRGGSGTSPNGDELWVWIDKCEEVPNE
ncbi:hypothetical protein M231_06332 [Tremella mesenterica]|uniref:Uncharacterized protein n=1 Tax=Tremella mesenterica TaxID=5217 RepID=A0A4Q1BDN8_TREME|nr:hypothetical protein M231_06332 [Tremella mesenterica]